MGRTQRRIGLAVLLVALVVLPLLLASGYQLFQLTMVVAYSVAILGLNLVTGYNGQISLGQGAFYAVGAYVTAIMMDKWDAPYWSTLPVSAVVCAGVGFLLGLPALRLGGLYLALTTFALAVATPQILKYKALEDWTGGVQGIVILKPDAPFGLPLSADQWVYLFTLAVGVLIFVLAYNIVRGRIGRAMRAIRDHPIAAEAMGIDIAQFKTRSFAVSAMITGVAGSLGAIAVQFVSPDSFGVALSISLFVGMVVGGGASIMGAVFGALFIQFVPNIADQVSKAAPGAIYGLILVGFMFLMPGGIAAVVRRQFSRLPGFGGADRPALAPYRR
jgi:branched-chain amino acid transport system permease protein